METRRAKPSTTPERQPTPFGRNFDRRQFLIHAAVLGLSTAGALAFLEACTQVDTQKGAIPTSTTTPQPNTMASAMAQSDSAAAFSATTMVPLEPPAEPSPVYQMPVMSADAPTPTSESLATRLAPPAASPPRPPAATANAQQPSPTPVTSSASSAVSPLRVQLAHLLRRAGFGATQTELNQFEKMGYQATVDYLLDYDKVDDSELANRIAADKFDMTRLRDMQRLWLIKMMYTKRPLRERMVLFWHGLLTSAGQKVNQYNLLQNQNELFRQNALGNFDALVKKVSRDPAMLIYLDNRVNRRGAANENYARELMELFTMGVGNYTEIDIRESARAFTGWTVNQNFQFVDNILQHDTGNKTFMGKTGNFNGDHMIDIIFQQRATARYLPSRLFQFLAYRNPDSKVIDRLADVFVTSKFSVRALVREILLSPEFRSPQAYRAIIRSPVDFVVSTFRTMGLETDAAGLAAAMSRMNQDLFDPPNVAGWPGGPSWLTSNTLIERLNFVNRIANARGSIVVFPPSGNARAGMLTALQQTMDFYITVLLDGNVPPDEWKVLQTYADRIAVAGATQQIVEIRQRSLVYLLLGSPDFELS